MKKSEHITKLYVVSCRCDTEMCKPSVHASFRAAYRAMINEAEITMIDWYLCDNDVTDEDQDCYLIKAKKDYEFWSDDDSCSCNDGAYCEWQIFESEVM